MINSIPLGNKILPWMANVLCGFLMWWASGVNAELKSIRTDMVGMNNKAYEMQTTWLRDINDIKVILASVPKKEDLPPAWFREYVRTIETKLDEHVKETKKP